MTTFNTILLDRTQWDWVLDAYGNIAMAEPPYALAQDVASAIKTFLGEVYYDETRGIPYWENILGQFPTLSAVQDYMVTAALTVPGVVQARCIINTFNDRVINGRVEFIDENGVAGNVNF